MLLITNTENNPFVQKIEEEFNIKAEYNLPSELKQYSICVLVLGTDQDTIDLASRINTVSKLPVIVQVKKEAVGLDLLKKRIISDYFVGDTHIGFVKALDRISRKEKIQKILTDMQIHIKNLHDLLES